MAPLKGNKITQLRKRDDRIAAFAEEKITKAVLAAIKASDEIENEARALKHAQRITEAVVKSLNQKFHERSIPAVEEVQDIVEEELIKARLIKTAKAYILYRDQHARLREMQSTLIDSDDLIEGYLKQVDWRVKENSNMAYSLQGLNNHVASAVSSHYWLNKIYPAEVREAHLNADLHLHDLQILAAYCCGWDLKDLLLRGFGGAIGKVESKPAKHFRVALGQIVNFFYTLQGETAGAQAFSSFDILLAPFIRYDKMTYQEVKQCLQEFLFNMNVPTRVGFQCLSEDTEILTPGGWASHEDLKSGDIIRTFNIKTKKIENQKVEGIFRKEYHGKMFNLKNRIQDQLISPSHRVVRKVFQSDNYILEPIEETIKLKSPFIIPIAGQNTNKDVAINDEQIKLMAWIIAEGTVERPGKYRCCYRVSIYQSKERNPENYKEIIKLLKHFKLYFDEHESSSLGCPVKQIRLNAESSRQIHQWFGTKDSVAFIPPALLNFSERQAKLFLQTYLKADGFENCKIATTDLEILDGLQAMAVNAGYGFTVLIRKPTIGKKDIFVLRLIAHQETYIQEVKEVDYKGIIWCPHTKNETVIARRKGKVFITGNTPFTNITMDLLPSKYVAQEGVIIGGAPQKETYGEFQPEIDTLNRAFAEVMLEGDAKGRVFTFPIPTYNITKDFNWSNPVLDPVWEMTAKYGVPYFSNFINSDMSPDDARSMCCRLRLDNRELRKKGGGLFGANPLTGSIGVVTINLARLGYLAKTKEIFFQRLARLMEIAKTSLEIKREAIERFTEQGLYPYSKFYLSIVKERFGQYWKNHFNTIGINGMNEAALNFLGVDKHLATTEGHEFAKETLDFMRERLGKYQEETNNLYNLEATPAEGTSYRFARKDKEMYPDIICANEAAYRAQKADPYYTNSSHLPVNHTDDIFEALKFQDDLQTRYTGGTVLHGFLGERVSSGEATKHLVKKIAENFHLPYYTLTPTFSVCPQHGYLAGEHFFCPKCDEVIGYVEKKVNS